MELKEQKKAPRKRPPTGAKSRTATRQKRRSPKRPTEDVVYTQPGPFNRNRFLLQLASVVAVVLALLFGMSIFFKVDTVTVAGSVKYTQWDVREASGIQEGENLLTLNEAKISSKIRSKLPYVDKVRVGIKLPGTVKIEIKELDVVYAVEVQDGTWALIRSDGCAVEQIAAADAESRTKILGVKIQTPEIGQSVKPVQPVAETTAEGATIPVTVDSTRQMDLAVTLLQYLEENGLIGTLASVDVSDVSNLEVWYGERFQILFGDESQLSYKIKLVKTAIDQYMENWDSGVLDVSMTVQPDPDKEYQVIYTPFS